MLDFLFQFSLNFGAIIIFLVKRCIDVLFQDIILVVLIFRLFYIPRSFSKIFFLYHSIWSRSKVLNGLASYVCGFIVVRQLSNINSGLLPELTLKHLELLLPLYVHAT